MGNVPQYVRGVGMVLWSVIS